MLVLALLMVQVISKLQFGTVSNMRKIDFIDAAVKNLYPQVQGIAYDRGTDSVTETNPQVEVDQTAVRAEVSRLENQYAIDVYQRQRAVEYPPIGDQLDALWKGGDAAAEMLAKVQAVKTKYPKPGA
jgi:hypothetical protein